MTADALSPTVPPTSTAIVPGPRGVPLLGNLPAFAKDPLGFLTGLRSRGDIVEWHLGRGRALLLNRPDLVGRIMAGMEREFTHSKISPMVKLLFGDGVVTSTGAEWRRKRSIVQPVVRPKQVRAYADAMVRCAAGLAAQWSDGDRVAVRQDMLGLAQRIAVLTLFGVESSGRESAIGAAMRVAQHRLASEINGMAALVPGWVPTPGRRRLRAALAQVDAEVARVVAEARASHADRDDLLSRLMISRSDDGTGLSDRELRDESVTLYIAGHETTAVTLTWIWYLLSCNPQALGRLRDELNRVLGGRLPTIDDYEHLLWCQYVFKEALRLYPPVWLLTCAAAVDTELDGHPVPKGTRVMASQWSLHRDPRWYDAPDEFRPERWEPAAAQKIPENAWVPFGGGPRVCIGTRFAQVEATLVIATLAQRHTLEVDPGEISPVPAFTLQPDNDVPATIRAR